MGKTALLIIGMFIITATYYGATKESRGLDTTNRVSSHQFEEIARSAALTGYTRAKQALADNFADATFTGSFSAGTYQATIDVNGVMAEVVVEGTVVDPAGEDVTKYIKGLFKYNQVVEGVALDFMDYAVIADSTVEMSGNTKIYVYDTSNPDLNANVHTNHDLDMQGPNADIEGFGTFVGTAYTTGGKPITDYFAPRSNPGSLPTAYQVAEDVDFPAFIPAEMISKVEVDRTHAGNLHISGGTLSPVPEGTRENPYVIHVQGNLTISGNTVIEGYTMFLVEGDISVSGDVQSNVSTPPGRDESSVALYAGGAVNITGTIDIWGQIFANGAVTFISGTPDFYGTVVSRSGADFNGNPTIYYRSAAPSLTVIWDNLKLIAYHEW